MQLSPQELQLFESMARNQPRFREWCVKEMGKQYAILVMSVEDMQMRRAQGYAQCLQQLIDALDATLTSR